MAVPAVPKSRFVAADIWSTVTPEHLVYFCLNVGDGDAQVLILPAVPTGDVDPAGNPVMRRPVMVVDAGAPTKLRRFLDALPAASGGRVPPIDVIDVVVATHPHGDHIAGLPDLLTAYAGRVAEYWDPGYFHPTGTYFKILELLARQTGVVYVQPTSGMRRFIGNTEVTVLTPSVGLRNRYDTYGVDINNSSISLRVATPAGRAKFVPGESWQLLEGVDERHQFSLVLGADSQTESWSQALSDFPQLVKSESEIAEAIGAATNDRDPLRTDVLKVAHHGSKKGVSYELVERMKPEFLIVSCAATSVHGFPHALNQLILREAKLNLAKSGGIHHPEDDHLRGVFYTAQRDSADQVLGSVAVVGSTSSDVQLWRLGDRTNELPDFTKARRWVRV
ncbi:MAG TPA: MBL fold metallo-hydrolase [Jiangellaceae bacterium]|nr:MBL fold metallo-hydrolase [Jiangellaceae bacterium]